MRIRRLRMGSKTQNCYLGNVSSKCKFLYVLVKMWHSQLWVLSLSILLSSISLQAVHNPKSINTGIKTSVYLSPPFFLQPGSVVDKYYFDIPFPKGHIALKNFDAEVIDELGIPVPLHETYLHHWVIMRYYGQKGTIDSRQVNAKDLDLSKIIMVRNAGVCKNTLGQYYGLGSETRKTSAWVPGPYGIEVGDPKEVPDGYEERWLLNIHAIDTRGVEDRLGCTECECSLYGVTEDKFGRPLPKNYTGGLHCCYDQTQCRMRKGFGGVERKLYLSYTVNWVNWDDNIVPVKIYIFDVTDSRSALSTSTEENDPLSCKVEYDVKACSLEGTANGDCVDTKRAKLVIPHGGDIIYGVAHQHSSGAGSALYSQDGRVLCTSIPTYGEGKEAGNEAGYIVGMSTCYPKPGSVRIADGELLTLVSNYSSTRQHTGVMGLFYILVAESQPKEEFVLLHHNLPLSWTNELLKHPWVFILMGGVVAVMIVVCYRRSYKGDEGYESLVVT